MPFKFAQLVVSGCYAPARFCPVWLQEIAKVRLITEEMFGCGNSAMKFYIYSRGTWLQGACEEPAASGGGRLYNNHTGRVSHSDANLY